MSARSRSRRAEANIVPPRIFLFIVVALTLLLAISFCLDAAHTAQGGSIDLRNRVTGARLLAAGIDPYFYKWSRDEPEAYCDPFNNPRLPVSKTTATPALLALTLPLAVLPYRPGQFLWLLLQWACLLGTGALWWCRCADARQKLLLGALLTASTYTAAWRLHAERGQSYVLLSFLFALWLTGTLASATRDRFLTGLAAGLLMALRPPFLLLLPFLVRRCRGQRVGAAVGLLIGIVVPLFFLPAIWSDYFTAMQTHSQFYRAGIDPAPGPQRFPATVEGIPTDTLANYLPIPYADFSVHALLRSLDAEPVPAALVLGAGATLFAGWSWWRRRQDVAHLLLGLAAWMFLFDLFLPAYRDTYNDVLILNVFALVPVVVRRFTPSLALGALALAAGIVIDLAVMPGNQPQGAAIDLSSLLLTLSVLGFLLLPEAGPKLDTAPASVQNEEC